MKSKLLSPTQLKEFRLQQDEQRKLRLQEIERKELEKKKLKSPKVLFAPQIELETEENSFIEVNAEEVVTEKTPYEVLEERIDGLSSIINSIKESKKYDEELAKLEILIATKIGFDEINIDNIFDQIEEVRNLIPQLPEIKTYDDELTSIKEEVKKISAEVNNNFIVESLIDRVDQLQISGSEIFTQHGENIKELKKVLFSLLDDFNNLSIPEKFDPNYIETDLYKIKQLFSDQIENLKEEISNLPKVKYYDEELEDLKNRIITIKESIPDLPEIKEYDDELESLKKEILEVQKSIPNLPEIRYYETEIENLQNQINLIESKIPEIPEIPEPKSYDSDIQKMDLNMREISRTLVSIRKSLRDMNKTIDNIPESIDWTHEIEYLYDQIEKLKKNPITIKEIQIVEKESENNTQNDIEESFNTPSSDVTKSDDALAPLNQNFVTFEDLAKHYRTFIMRVQQQLSTLGGGGEVNLRFLDDIDRTSIADGRVLSYDAATKKFKFISPGAANSLWSETLGGDVYRISNVGIHTDDPQVALDVYGDVSITGVITATEFSGTATEAIKIAELDKTLEYISGTLSTITTLYGTKTLYYNSSGILTSIVGTGIYESKEFTYDIDGNLIFVNVL